MSARAGPAASGADYAIVEFDGASLYGYAAGVACRAQAAVARDRGVAEHAHRLRIKSKASPLPWAVSISREG